jgi:pyridoxal 5'-phosphate synthase pdxT subunit
VSTGQGTQDVNQDRECGPVVGVLGIQGDIEKHLASLARIGARGRRVLAPRDLDGLTGLIIPGGESTTMSKGLVRHELVKPIQEFVEAGGAILGTCAGAILLARESRNHPVPTLGLIDLEAERNAYGTQLDSFIVRADPVLDGDARPDAIDDWADFECVFIRAPRLRGLGRDVEVLLRVDGEPVLAREGNRWACSFHPELTDDLRVHRAFLAAFIPGGSDSPG